MPHELCIEEAGGSDGSRKERRKRFKTDGQTTTNSKEHVISLAQPESG